MARVQTLSPVYPSVVYCNPVISSPTDLSADLANDWEEDSNFHSSTVSCVTNFNVFSSGAESLLPVV